MKLKVSYLSVLPLLFTVVSWNNVEESCWVTFVVFSISLISFYSILKMSIQIDFIFWIQDQTKNKSFFILKYSIINVLIHSKSIIVFCRIYFYSFYSPAIYNYFISLYSIMKAFIIFNTLAKHLVYNQRTNSKDLLLYYNLINFLPKK